MALSDGADPPASAISLADALAAWAGADAQRLDIVQVVAALCGAAQRLAALLAAGPLVGDLAIAAGSVNSDGDAQKAIDLQANDLFIAALRGTPAAYLASEESADTLTLNAGGSLAVAIDPLDGSASVGVNLTVGAIFSILPAAESADASFLRPCADQLAAGYFLFGASTMLVITLGDGVDVFAVDPSDHSFKRAASQLRVPPAVPELAINMANRRHWPAPIAAYVHDCQAGASGRVGADVYIRWHGVMVAEAHRVLLRGGIYIYSADARPGYENGRLRLIYEAAPIAMLMEQAGGAATDGDERILAKTPQSLHQRTPLVFGSSAGVETLRRYSADASIGQDNAPLFQRRGLFSS